MKKGNLKKLNFTQNLNPLEFIFQPTIYRRIINPGLKKPFDYEMLSEVEEVFQFDINQDPRTFKGLYNEEDGKLRLTFWRILMNNKRICFIYTLCLFFSSLCPILVAYYTKEFLLELQKKRAILKDLLWLVLKIMLFGISRSIFDCQQILFGALFSTYNQNLIKVKKRSKNRIFFNIPNPFSLKNFITKFSKNSDFFFLDNFLLL